MSEEEEVKSVSEEELKKELIEAADDFANQIQEQVAAILDDMFVNPVDDGQYNSSMSLICGHMALKLAAFSLALGDIYSVSKSGKNMEERAQLMLADILMLAREARGQVMDNPPNKILN